MKHSKILDIAYHYLVIVLFVAITTELRHIPGNRRNYRSRKRMRLSWTEVHARGYAWSVVLILALILAVPGCQQKSNQVAPLEVTLAVHGSPYSGLIAVADDKGFFKKEGINVKINLHPSGQDSLKAMIKGDAQVATVSDIAFAGKVAEDPSLRVISSIGTSTGSQIVARKDRNITKPADLRGKRIGYSPLTSSDYFLYAFLLAQNISRNQVIPVAIPPVRQTEAIVSGEVDAVSAFDTYAYEANKKLGENAVAWNSQGNVDYLWLLVTRETSTQSSEAIKRLLRALINAQEFVLKNEDEAKKIISRKWDIDAEYVNHSWDETRLFVSLSQSIITGVQNYAKWKMLSEGKKGKLPDALQYIYADPLMEIDPKLVTIVR